MIHPLVPSSSDILREVMPEFDFQSPPTDPEQLARDLAETMIENRGLGLAAPQIGLRYRAFAICTNPILVMFNPRLVDVTKDTIIDLEEGCLSFPNLFVSIKRPRIIKVRYALPNGVVQTVKYDGITARCVQHELDHLNGIVFTKHVHKIHLDRAMRKKTKYDRMRKNYKQIDNDVVATQKAQPQLPPGEAVS